MGRGLLRSHRGVIHSRPLRRQGLAYRWTLHCGRRRLAHGRSPTTHRIFSPLRLSVPGCGRGFSVCAFDDELGDLQHSQLADVSYPAFIPPYLLIISLKTDTAPCSGGQNPIRHCLAQLVRRYRTDHRPVDLETRRSEHGIPDGQLHVRGLQLLCRGRGGWAEALVWQDECPRDD